MGALPGASLAQLKLIHKYIDVCMYVFLRNRAMNPAIATGGEYCRSRLCGRTGGPTLLAQGWLCGREALIAGAFLEMA